MNERYAGTISTFKADRGYGFIRFQDSRQEVFFHVTKTNCSPEQLVTGAAVQFGVAMDKRTERQCAVNVEFC